MRNATRLTGIGKLMDATRLIQRALARTASDDAPVRPAMERLPQAKTSDPGNIRAPESMQAEPPAHRQSPELQPSVAAASGRASSFTLHQFDFEGKTYPYRLFIPAVRAGDEALFAKMPLVVLLHGCKQDAADFAHGTAMNTLAQTNQAMVLYPEQITSSNAMRCWNWFESEHQQAGRGEPGMIAALTQKITRQHDADPARVYVAGLSAGGAMAAVVAALYPQVFAAVGIHSGLAAGAAQSMVQAFSAMQKGSKGRMGNANSDAAAMPTIVFHGSADQTVNPKNAGHITQFALTAFKSEGQTLVKSTAMVAARKDEPTERTQYLDASGKPFVESWSIAAGPHAWSGGSAQGSYTDPDGPDASEAMLAFFLQHQQHPRQN